MRRIPTSNYLFLAPLWNFVEYFLDWGYYAVRDHKHSSWLVTGHNHILTCTHLYWFRCILKVHTRNTGGTVQLRSTNPLDKLIINFNYFDTGTTAGMRLF